MSSTHHLRSLGDPSIWKSIAGTSVQIPAINSRVYYFPQGHAEQSLSTPNFTSLVYSHPFTLCQLVGVGFFANVDTDEVFVKMRLLPMNVGRGQGVLQLNKQNLRVRDVHGVVWEFRHIFRGTPRRHLLTTGWSKFVNNKKLVAGDSVVFMRNHHSGEMSVGIRRAVKVNADCNGRWNYYEDRKEMEGFSRNVKGRVATEAVEEAAELAAKGLGFEIVYYPGAGSADFVVKAEKVKASFSVFWMIGMRVRMAVETEDSSRRTWVQGTVTSAGFPDNRPWRGFPWRMLQVTWDEPEARKNVKRVSPWQVESAVATPSLHPEFHPTKKCRISHDLGLLPDGDEELLFPMTGLSHSLTEQLNPSWMNYNSFPASIQGARQDQICVSGVSGVILENSRQICNNYFVGSFSPMAETVSTELNIGSSQLENLSTDSQSSVHFFGNEQVKKQRVCNFPPKVRFSSIQLFGKIINTTNPVEGGIDDIRCTEDDGSDVYKGGIDYPLKHSLTYPFTEFVDTVDV